MMLRTSSRKVNPFLGMLSFTLRKNLGIIIILTIAALLYCPGHFIVNILDYYEGYGMASFIDNQLMNEFMITVSVVAGIAVTAFNFINFTFMYQKRSSDVFHAFPLTRTELLLSRMAAGFIFTLIPVTVCYIAYAVLAGFNPWMTSGFIQILIAYLHTLLVMLVCSSYSMIFVVCAGSLFDLALSFVGANAALLIIAAVVNVMLEDLLIGYNGDGLSQMMKVFSPLYYSGIGLSYLENVKYYGISNQTVGYIIGSLAYTTVFTVAAVILYNHRKAEKGGQAYAYKFIYVICSILAGVCGGYFLGYIFAEGRFNIIFWIFAVIGAVITNIVYGAVTFRGFKNTKFSALIGGVSAIVLPVVAAVVSLGFFGYSSRVPKAENVSYATVRSFNEDIEFDDVSKVTDIHKRLLDSGAVVGNTGIYGEQTRWIYFYYTLDDGSSMSRKFHIVESKAADVLLELYKSEERIIIIEENLQDSDVQAIDIGISTEEDYYGTYLTRAETEKLLELYKQDIKNADASYITEDVPYIFDISWGDGAYNNYYYTLEFSKEFSNVYNYFNEIDIYSRAEMQENK